MKKSLTFLASFLLAGGFVFSESVQAGTTVLKANWNTSSSEIGNSTENYTTADGDTNFYTVTINPNVDYNSDVYQGVLSGNLNLTLSGSDSMGFALGKPQTYKGNTTVNNGILILTGTSTLSTGSVTLHGGANLHTGNYSGSTATLANDFYFGTNAVLNPGWNKTLVLTGKLADESGVTGKFTVQANNGAVRLTPSDGKVAVTGGVVVDGSGYQPIGSGTYTGRLHVGTDLTFASKLTVNGYVDLEGHTVSVPDFAAGNAGLVRNTTGTGTFKLSLSANSTLSTPVNFDGTSALIVEKDWTGGKLTLTGKSSGTTTLKASSGTVELGQNTANTSVIANLDLGTGTADDHVTAKVTGSSAKQVSGSVLMGDYAVFDLNGHDQTVPSFYSSGTKGGQDVRYTTGNTHASLTNSSETAATFTITNEGATHVFDGTISGKLNVDLKLSSWYFLNGTNSNWDGWLKVTGSQIVADGKALPGTVILNGATLHNGAQTTGTYNSNIQLTTSGGTIMAGWDKNMTMNGVISDAEAGKPGKLNIKADGGIVVLTNKNTYTGGTFFIENDVKTAKLRLDVDDALPAGGDVTFSSNHAHYVNLNGHTASIGKLNSTYTVSTIKNDTSTQSTLKVGYGITDATATATYAGTFSGPILLEKVGSGTQVLTGSSTTLNGKVTAGVLELAGSEKILNDVEVAGGTLKTTGSGTLFTGTVKMTSGTLDACGNDLTITTLDGAGGTLTNTDSEHTSVYTIQGTSAAPNVKMAGNTEFHFTGGAKHWSGDNSAYSRDVYLENTGLFYLANEKALGTGTIHLNANLINESISPTLNNNIVLSGTNNGLRAGYGTSKVITVNGVISGDYALNLNNGETNAGIITLNGTNTYTGGTNLYGSRGETGATPYILGNNQALGTGTVNVLANSELQLNATTENRVISNAIVISKGKNLTVSRTGTNQAVLTSNVTGAGTLIVSPGVTFAGTGSVANLTLSSGSVYEINLNELKAAGVHDVLTVTNTLTTNSDVTFKFVSDAPADLIGWEFNYMKLETPKENWATNVTFDYSEAGDASLWLNVTDAQGGALLVDSNAVPEPATWVLLFVGAMLLASFRKIK